MASKYDFCALILFSVVARITYAKTDTDDRGIILTSGYNVYTVEGTTHLYGLLLSLNKSPRDMSFQLHERIFQSCDVDIRRNMIYLFDKRHRSIVVGNNFDMSMNKKDVIFTNEHHVYSTEHVKVAVDWVSHNIYWTDPILGAILMQPGSQSKDRSLYKIIVQEHLDRPSGIALDPLSGYLFWTDSSKTSYRIERSSLTGQNGTVIMVSSILRIYALTVDVKNKRIYFTKQDYIESIDYDGHARKHIFNIWESEFYDIALFQDVVIATDYVGNFYNNSYLDAPALNSLINVRGICVYDINQQPLPEQEFCTSAGCEDICVNGPDKATCLCRAGFELHQNGKNCTEVAGGYHRALMTNNGSHLCLLSMHVIPYDSSHTMHCFYNRSEEEISYIDVNMDAREVFFVMQNSIYRIPVDTKYVEEEKIVDDENNGYSITGLSYDWVNFDLYWSQTNPDGIFAINLNTRDLRQVVHDNTTSSPREVLVVPHEEKLFWIADTGNESMILSGSLAGDSESIHILNIRQKLQNPIRLYHDIKYEQVAVLNQIETFYDVLYISYTGTEKQEFWISETKGDCVLYRDLLLLVAVDTANDTVLYTLDVMNSRQFSTVAVFEGLGSVISIKMIDLDVLQPEYPSPCGDTAEAGCNQICVAHADKAQCLCEIGYTPLEDNKTCSSFPLKDNFILITDVRHGKLFQLALDNSEEVNGIQIASTHKLQSILYNPATESVIWVQYGESHVFTTSLDGNKENRIADISIFRGLPLKFTLDITTNNIYFTGLRAKPTQSDSTPFMYIIGVISPSGDANIIYEGEQVYSMGIVLHPGKGLMFWTDRTSRIMRAGMDGSDVTIIAAGGRSYHSLAVDYFEERLYWYELSKGIIYRSDLDGNDVTEFYTVADGATVPVELKFVGGYLYYAGPIFVYVKRLNKHNTSDVTVFGLHTGIGTIEDFDVYSSSESFLAPKNKACSDNNGNCSHICLPNSMGGRTCACRYGFTLQTDNKTCNGTMCPKNIPNGQLSEDCIPKFGMSCDNFTCHQGYEKSKAVSLLICNESGLWNYDLSMLCTEPDESSQPRVIVIAIGAGCGLVVFITAIVILLCLLYSKGKILTRWSQTNDITADLPNSLDDSGIADTSMNYLDHLAWLRTRIDQFLILDADADKGIVPAPNENERQPLR